jgi:hypothetical protein
MKNNKSLRALSFIVIGYMLLALLWWAILLHRKNTEVFVLKSDLLRERFMTATGVANVDVTTMPEFQELKPDYWRGCRIWHYACHRNILYKQSI